MKECLEKVLNMASNSMNNVSIFLDKTAKKVEQFSVDHPRAYSRCVGAGYIIGGSLLMYTSYRIATMKYWDELAPLSDLYTYPVYPIKDFVAACVLSTCIIVSASAGFVFSLAGIFKEIDPEFDK